MQSYLPRPTRELIERARQLRQGGTSAEQLLWELLRDGRLHGRHFRRQHPIGSFVADFFCDDARLVVELDGAIHREPSQEERDRAREDLLRECCLAVLRFNNREVFARTECVLEQISDFVLTHSFEHPPKSNQPSPPSPLSRRCGRGGIRRSEPRGSGAGGTHRSGMKRKE